MRMGYSVILAMLLALLSGCGDISVDTCQLEVAGCDVGLFSCPEADNCYATRNQCEASGECDD